MGSIPLVHEQNADLVVAGAGIVGLAHAYEAVRRGMRVHVVDRDERAVGASVRNFGHVCLSGQAERAFDFALAGRATWLEVAAQAGFLAEECGAVVVARAADELAVLEEFAAARDGFAELLDRRGLASRVPIDHDGVVGGAWLPQDLRVDQRCAVAAIAAWLQSSAGVTFSWSTSLLEVAPGVASTTRGPISTPATVVCVNHDVDRLFPELAADARVERCRLHMLEVDSPAGAAVDPAVLTGTSLLRYGAFVACPSAADVRTRLSAEHPALAAAAVNLMFTQRPGGTLVIGDTHQYAINHVPFADERLDDVILSETARLLHVERLTVRARWQGVYASAPGEFLIAEPVRGTLVVSVTSGIGMTTAFGLARHVIDEIAAMQPAVSGPL